VHTLTEAPRLYRAPLPDEIAQADITAFAQACGAHDYASLHRWSVQHPDAFWGALWRWLRPLHDGDPHPAITGHGVERARFFPDLRLSYAENLLHGQYLHNTPDAEALVERDETGRRAALSWAALDDRVRRCAQGLRALGVAPGDRLLAICRSAIEAAVLCLAASAVGAIWSSASPDMGPQALWERARALRPRWLAAHSHHRASGQRRDLAPSLAALAARLDDLAGAIALDDDGLPGVAAPVHALAALEAHTPGGFDRLPFDAPLFALSSSGTTGPPKCIVHGAGGALLQHLKEHRLHCGLRPRDVLYVHTNCGWMMWPWALSALATGVTVVLYDGAVSYPGPDALPNLLLQERVTAFGTSPAWLRYAQLSKVPLAPLLQAGHLRLLVSTGAPLSPGLYDFARDHLGGLRLDSISGGTDILGCFVLGHPALPIYRGESACIALGMDVRALHDGLAAHIGQGELVCASPFPTRPVAIWRDDDAQGALHEAYFAQHPGLWTHGDLIDLTERGTARVLGRSDGVINIKGVRIGPAEIYRALDAIPEITEAMTACRHDDAGLGGDLVLLIVLRPGDALDRPLLWRIKRLLKEQHSPHHVPRWIIPVDELPRTHSGKRSERALQDLLDGRPPRNLAAIANPDCLPKLAALIHAAAQL
jgi:acetoacetyl-CoA synthetase